MRSSLSVRGRLVAALLVVGACGVRVPAADDFVPEDVVPPAPPPAAAPAPAPRLLMEMMQRQAQQAAAAAAAAEARAGAAPAERAAYLGVVTGPVTAPVRAQLELPDGVGLSVDALAAGGPAERAGVRRHDVIHKFDDQLVCASEQLTTLVRAAGAGATVSLTLIRGGKERTVDVVLEEHDVPRAAAAGPFGGLPGLPLEFEGLFPEGLLPGGDDGAAGEVRRQVQQAFEQAQAQAQALGGDARARVFSIFPNGRSQSMTVINDGQGSVELRETDGKRTVTIRDADGKEVFTGPLDTEADREAVPEEVRERVRAVEERAAGGQPKQEGRPEGRPGRGRSGRTI